MKIAPVMRSRQDFPPSGLTVPGMKVIKADESGRAVRLFHGVEYAQKSGRKLHLNILAPRDDEEDSESRYPLLVFVQGSAWREQELDQQLPQLVRYAASGLVIAIVEYRPSSLAPFPAQIRDARTAMRYMTAHAAEYHADPDRLMIWGDSSGGHTISMLALTAGLREFSDEIDCDHDVPIRGVIDFYGPSDVGTMNDEPSIQDHDEPHSPEGEMLGGYRVSERPDLVRKASPLDYVLPGKTLPPFLILHGDRDRLVPLGQSIALFSRLRQTGHSADLYKVEGADHGGPAFWTSEEVFALTRAFITSCCG